MPSGRHRRLHALERQFPAPPPNPELSIEFKAHIYRGLWTFCTLGLVEPTADGYEVVCDPARSGELFEIEPGRWLTRTTVSMSDEEDYGTVRAAALLLKILFVLHGKRFPVDEYLSTLSDKELVAAVDRHLGEIRPEMRKQDESTPLRPTRGRRHPMR